MGTKSRNWSQQVDGISWKVKLKQLSKLWTRFTIPTKLVNHVAKLICKIMKFSLHFCKFIFRKEVWNKLDLETPRILIRNLRGHSNWFTSTFIVESQRAWARASHGGRNYSMVLHVGGHAAAFERGLQSWAVSSTHIHASDTWPFCLYSTP